MAMYLLNARVVKHDRLATNGQENKFIFQGFLDQAKTKLATVEVTVKAQDTEAMGIDPIASLTGNPTFSVVIDREV